MNNATRTEIMSRYRVHSRRFEAAATRRSVQSRRVEAAATHRSGGTAEVIPSAAPLLRLLRDLTTRESEVLQLVADGLGNREIGQRLVVSEETVKSHVRHLLAKLHAQSRAHATAVGFRHGLVV